MARMIKMLINYLWINDWGNLGFHDGEFTFSSFQGTSTFLSPFFHLLHFLLLNNLFCQIRVPSLARLFSILVPCRLLPFAPPPSAVRRWLDAGTPGSQSGGGGGGGRCSSVCGSPDQQTTFKEFFLACAVCILPPIGTVQLSCLSL